MKENLSIVKAKFDGGPNEHDWASVILRIAERRGKYAIVLFEDEDGVLLMEPVNVESPVHQKGIYYEAHELFKDDEAQ